MISIDHSRQILSTTSNCRIDNPHTMNSNTLQFSDDRTCNCNLQCSVSLESFDYKCTITKVNNCKI
eukprot:Awhi_evm1s14554